MKIKGLRVISLPENTAFMSIVLSLLPIFQTRLDIVAEWRFMLQGVTFFRYRDLDCSGFKKAQRTWKVKTG